MRRYLVLARVRYGPRLLLGAAVIYPGQAALGLVVLLALHRATGSFAFAGAASAVYTIAFSISSIAQGRLIDRRGAHILLPVAVVLAVAIAAMDVALTIHAGAGALAALASAVGASIPAAGASLRTCWSSLLSDPDTRATAFAYQSVAQDAGFVVGPAALGALATVSPVLALSCCGALIAAGTLTVATIPMPLVSARASAHTAGQSILAALGPLATALFAVGVALGAIDVSTVAFATEHHTQQLAGMLLAAFAIGSITAGSVYGARGWRSALKPRLLGCLLALAVLALAPVAAPSIILAAPALALAGMPLAATLTTAYLLASEHAPAGRQTETYALLSLTLNAGSALGGALGGKLVASGSARPGFLLAVATPLLGAATLILPTFLKDIRNFTRRRSAAT